MKTSNQSRRDFLIKSAVIAPLIVAPSIISSCSGSKGGPALSPDAEPTQDISANDKLNIAVIGLGMGFSNLKNCAGENIVAICDVDENIMNYRLKDMDKSKMKTPKTFVDYRVMLDKMGKDIDAVVIATPDHSHAKVTLDCMQAGKHVYTQKPMTHSVYESRVLTKAAEKYTNIVTQMGNQGSSGEGTQWMCDSIWNGDIGEVTEVHAWTNRPIWPQPLNTPTAKENVPNGLDWDLWLGPARAREYSKLYHPWNWRGWWDYGTGALGDMACHIMDVVYRSLRLTYPYAVEGSASHFTTDAAPEAEKVTYYFNERLAHGKIDMPKVKLTWYDGGFMPDRPLELPDGVTMGDNGGNGVMFVGTKGKLFSGCYASSPLLISDNATEGYVPPKIQRRVKDGISGHEKDWIRACKESEANRVLPKSHFGISGPLNEGVVMGTVAPRLAQLKKVLRWDGENMKFTNIGSDEQVKLPTSRVLDVSGGRPTYKTKHQTFAAQDFAEELIKGYARKGWELDFKI